MNRSMRASTSGRGLLGSSASGSAAQAVSISASSRRQTTHAGKVFRHGRGAALVRAPEGVLGQFFAALFAGDHGSRVIMDGGGKPSKCNRTLARSG